MCCCKTWTACPNGCLHQKIKMFYWKKWWLSINNAASLIIPCVWNQMVEDPPNNYLRGSNLDAVMWLVWAMLPSHGQLLNNKILWIKSGDLVLYFPKVLWRILHPLSITYVHIIYYLHSTIPSAHFYIHIWNWMCAVFACVV